MTHELLHILPGGKEEPVDGDRWTKLEPRWGSSLAPGGGGGNPSYAEAHTLVCNSARARRLTFTGSWSAKSPGMWRRSRGSGLGKEKELTRELEAAERAMAEYESMMAVEGGWN